MKSLLERIDLILTEEKDKQKLKDIYNYYKEIRGTHWNRLEFLSSDTLKFKVFDGNTLVIDNKAGKKILQDLKIIFEDLGYKNEGTKKASTGEINVFTKGDIKMNIQIVKRKDKDIGSFIDISINHLK